jgi:hypothetical protein
MRRWLRLARAHGLASLLSEDSQVVSGQALALAVLGLTGLGEYMYRGDGPSSPRAAAEEVSPRPLH